jgi:hypothetical protein
MKFIVSFHSSEYESEYQFIEYESEYYNSYIRRPNKYKYKDKCYWDIEIIRNDNYITHSISNFNTSEEAMDYVASSIIDTILSPDEKMIKDIIE